ncbi:MAG: hypothetical protein QG584_1368 [Pseudomonadota bacterium]|nr:hypothetical protein [Pseudomonadota bacterium]
MEQNPLALKVIAFRKASVIASLLCLAPLSVLADSVWPTQEATDRAYAVQDAAEVYAKNLRLDGVVGRSALDKLLGEGFMCGFTAIKKDAPPLIFCTKSRPPIPDCVVLDLYVFLNWTQQDRAFEKLVTELDKVNVNGIEPACKLPFKKR